MSVKSNNNTVGEEHILIVTRVIDIIKGDEKRISMDIVDYMRNYIDELVSEEINVTFWIYGSYCTIPFLKTIVKSLKDLDQPVRIELRILSISDILNTVEEQLKKEELSGESNVKSRTILDLTGESINIEQIAKITSDLLKRFQVLNDFESILFK